MKSTNTYLGRFAPSPSGPLHFGSLLAALASFLDARANQGKWLLRIEDLDPPRESKSAASEIIQQLHYFGFEWDGEVLFQSTRIPAYQAALTNLTKQNLCYLCTCSRKSYGQVYPGKCRGHIETDGTIRPDKPAAIRLLVNSPAIQFEDNILGPQSCIPEKEIGDFIIKRKDGLFAYQLAVVVDDEHQGINHVVRGSDLLDSTAKQIYLGQRLGFPEISFTHIPVITDVDGHKLSKQSGAAAVAKEDLASVLNLALKALGQARVATGSGPLMLAKATQQWQLARVPKNYEQALSEL